MGKILLIALALLLVTVMLTTWGSIGSIVMLFCLIVMGAALLYQHFLTNRDDDLWQSE